VDILPYLNYKEIYDRLKKDEPWNSPHNARVVPNSIENYICPIADRDENDCSSNYVAVIGPSTIWKANESQNNSEWPKDRSRSVVAVEVVDSGKHWAEPFALTVDEVLENMRTGKGVRISTCDSLEINVLFADCRVHAFPTKMPLSLWRKILNGEINNFDNIESQIDPNSPDMVDVYRPKIGKVTFILSVIVWLFSIIWLFYRAIKSRKIITQASSVVS
jgi:hypothetical protein